MQLIEHAFGGFVGIVAQARRGVDSSFDPVIILSMRWAISLSSGSLDSLSYLQQFQHLFVLLGRKVAIFFKLLLILFFIGRHLFHCFSSIPLGHCRRARGRSSKNQRPFEGRAD